MKNNQVLKNIIKVAFSNIIIVFAGVINGFLIPKVMSVTDYGFYKIFMLYAGYATLLHVGFIDGVLIVYAGNSLDNINKKLFRSFSRFLFLLLFVPTFLIAAISLFLPQTEYKIVFALLSLNVLFVNISLYFQVISQTCERFTELSIRNILKSALNIFSCVILFVVYRFANYATPYYLMIIITIFINFLLAAWYIFTYRNLVFGEALPFSKIRKEILVLFKEGLPYTIAALLASLILNIDRQFVSILFSTETYAIYAFCYNLIALITTAIGAISTVFYPYLKKRQTSSFGTLHTLRFLVTFFIGFLMLSYFALVYLVPLILPKYSTSLQFFYIVLPGLVFSSSITVVLVNYFKVLFKQNVYMLIGTFIILLSVLANVIAYFIFKTPSSISWASLIVMFVWYMISNYYFYVRYKVSFATNLFYSLSVIIGFYIIAHFNSDWVGGIKYLLFFIIVTLAFNYKTIHSFFGGNKINENSNHVDAKNH